MSETPEKAQLPDLSHVTDVDEDEDRIREFYRKFLCSRSIYIFTPETYQLYFEYFVKKPTEKSSGAAAVFSRFRSLSLSALRRVKDAKIFDFGTRSRYEVPQPGTPTAAEATPKDIRSPVTSQAASIDNTDGNAPEANGTASTNGNDGNAPEANGTASTNGKVGAAREANGAASANDDVFGVEGQANEQAATTSCTPSPDKPSHSEDKSTGARFKQPAANFHIVIPDMMRNTPELLSLKAEYGITDERFEELVTNMYLNAYGNAHLILRSLVRADGGFMRTPEEISKTLSTLTEERAVILDQLLFDVNYMLNGRCALDEFIRLPGWTVLYDNVSYTWTKLHGMMFPRLVPGKRGWQAPKLTSEHIELLTELLEHLEKFLGLRKWWLSATKLN